ncbi:MAG TPA: methyltransferase domain-containing protein [Oligoflexia bacterium]|nr:methyltransferase domain-containing protein [Oligoflexia bacterium]
MRYELKTLREKLGPVELTLETIADLDRAIDSLCEGVDEKSAERIFVEELCPYFGVVWPAARALGEHVARMGSWLKDQRILEVGCGLAIPSLVAAKLGARVTASDFHPEVPVFLARNQRHNELTFPYLHLDWRASQNNLGKFDFVIGSDVLYENSHPKDVARTLSSYCEKKGHIILADPGRSYLQAFLDELQGFGFRYDILIRNVLDGHNDRAGDRRTKEVFVISCTSQS